MPLLLQGSRADRISEELAPNDNSLRPRYCSVDVVPSARASANCDKVPKIIDTPVYGPAQLRVSKVSHYFDTSNCFRTSPKYTMSRYLHRFRNLTGSHGPKLWVRV